VHFSLPLGTNAFLEDAMINNYNDPGRLECPRAFHTDRSWYNAYWYSQPALRRPGLFSRGVARLVVAFQRRPVLRGAFVESIRAGMAWASRTVRETQSEM
jgi:hypothetical protein